MATHSRFLPGKSHGQRSRAGCNTCIRKRVIHKSKSHSVMSNSVTPWTKQCMKFSRPEYWSGSLSLLQRIFPTQGSNPGLPHCRQILCQLSHQESHNNTKQPTQEDEAEAMRLTILKPWALWPFSEVCHSLV